jgi:hypothetical protein
MLYNIKNKACGGKDEKNEEKIFLKNIVFERFIIYISYSISCNSAYNCYIRISNSKDGFQKK